MITMIEAKRASDRSDDIETTVSSDRKEAG
jgi:hypothetical protein